MKDSRDPSLAPAQSIPSLGAVPEITRHAFTDVEQDQLRGFVGRRFDRILSDGFCVFRFVAAGEVLDARTTELVATSQNYADEIFAVRLFPSNEPGEDDVTWKLVASDIEVESVHIVRALVWFTDQQTFSTRAEALAHGSAETDATIREMIAGATGGYEEVTTHPSEIETVEAPVANLVDVGFVARVGGLDLACFAWWNWINRESDYISDENRAEVLAHYELVPLDPTRFVCH